MSPSLYDLLDVDDDATGDEIRAAWKAAIADLGPTDRRFRAYNQAAEVLLDPEKRAAYDAERAEAEAEPATEPPEVEEGTLGARHETVDDDTSEEESESEPSEPEPEPSTDEEPAEVRRPPGWMTAVVGAVAVAVLVVTIVAWVRFFPSGDEAGWVDSVVDAAAEAAPKALAYDYRTLDEDISAAQALMTQDQRARHNELMSDLRGEVESQQAVVESEVVGSGLVRGDSEKADVLVLVNQHATRTDDQGGEREVLIPLWVTLKMVNVDGEWLIDRMVNEGVVASTTGEGEGQSESDGDASPGQPKGSGTDSPGDTGGAGE